MRLFTPTQAAEFSGPGRQALVLYAPDWSELLLEALRLKPAAYEAGWSFDVERRAHVLTVAYEGVAPFAVALVDGVHNPILAQIVRGCALALSPYPLYRDPPDQAVDRLFEPDLSLLLPQVPNPLG